MPGFWSGQKYDSNQTIVPMYNTSDDTWQTPTAIFAPANSSEILRQEAFNVLASVQNTNGGAGAGVTYLAGYNNSRPSEELFATFNNGYDPQIYWRADRFSGMPVLSASTTQHVRLGTSGMLVSVGGIVADDASNETLLGSYMGAPVANQNTSLYRDMASIQLYDIATQTWFSINATGDVPSPRERPCSAVSAAPDDSSFQMLIHGGLYAANTLDDAYILTMPAFHWIKINTTFAYSNGSLPHWPSNTTYGGRYDHFCATYQDRQMFVIGGYDSFNLLLGTGMTRPCTNNIPVLRVLDVSTFQWQTQFSTLEPYQVPSVVSDIIGGGPSGGSRPASFWNKTLGDYAPLFTLGPVQKSIPPAIKHVKAQSKIGNVTSIPSTSSRKLKNGVIAGISVGGISGLCLIGALTVFFIKLAKRKAVKREAEEQQEYRKAELENRSIVQVRPAEIDGCSAAAAGELDAINFVVEAPAVEHCAEAPPAEI